METHIRKSGGSGNGRRKPADTAIRGGESAAKQPLRSGVLFHRTGTAGKDSIDTQMSDKTGMLLRERLLRMFHPAEVREIAADALHQDRIRHLPHGSRSSAGVRTPARPVGTGAPAALPERGMPQHPDCTWKSPSAVVEITGILSFLSDFRPYHLQPFRIFPQDWCSFFLLNAPKRKPNIQQLNVPQYRHTQ